MFSDIVDLRDFYGSSLGQVARRMIRRRIRMIWPDVSGQKLLAVGYATPYLRPFRNEAERVLAVMPAAQGVFAWPADGSNVVTLADEGDLPIPDYSVDRVLLVHALECSEQVRRLLEESWRVLGGGGRLLVVVPNRRGIWARLDRTPFGHGHPYTPNQLSRLLRDTMFTPVRTVSALFIPPFTSRVPLTWAPAWEGIGERWFTRFAGVVMIEATKQIYVKGQTRPARRRSLSGAMPRLLPGMPAGRTPAETSAAARSRALASSLPAADG